MKKVMAIDQYGQTEHGLDAEHPRKALLERLHASSARKMYVDTKEGQPKHIGYIVGGRWFTFYNVTQWERPANGGNIL